jgi:hypothetical protein
MPVPKIAHLIIKFSKFRELAFPDKRILILSMLILPFIAALLRTLGFKKTKSLLERHVPCLSSFHAPQEDDMTAIRNLARIVHIAAQHSFYKANCLKESILLWFLLRRNSIHCEIKIGIQKTSTSQFNAHSWVDCGGLPLIDSEDTINRFSVFQACSTTQDNESNRESLSNI